MWGGDTGLPPHLCPVKTKRGDTFENSKKKEKVRWRSHRQPGGGVAIRSFLSHHSHFKSWPHCSHKPTTRLLSHPPPLLYSCSTRLQTFLYTQYEYDCFATAFHGTDNLFERCFFASRTLPLAASSQGGGNMVSTHTLPCDRAMPTTCLFIVISPPPPRTRGGCYGRRPAGLALLIDEYGRHHRPVVHSNGLIKPAPPDRASLVYSSYRLDGRSNARRAAECAPRRSQRQHGGVSGSFI